MYNTYKKSPARWIKRFAAISDLELLIYTEKGDRLLTVINLRKGGHTSPIPRESMPENEMLPQVKRILQ